MRFIYGKSKKELYEKLKSERVPNPRGLFGWKKPNQNPGTDDEEIEIPNTALGSIFKNIDSCEQMLELRKQNSAFKYYIDDNIEKIYQNIMERNGDGMPVIIFTKDKKLNLRKVINACQDRERTNYIGNNPHYDSYPSHNEYYNNIHGKDIDWGRIRDLTPDRRENYYEDRERGLDHGQALFINDFDNDQREKYYEDRGRGLNHTEAWYVSGLPDDRREKYYEAKDRGLPHWEALYINDFDNDRREKYYEARDRGLPHWEAYSVSDFDNDKREKYYEARDRGLGHIEALQEIFLTLHR